MRRRGFRWWWILLAPFVLILVGVPTLFIVMDLTARRFHPKPQELPSLVGAAPDAQWQKVVEQSRRLVRANMSEANLPGVSVAVGVNGKLQWVEGFGFANVEHDIVVKPEHRFRMGTVGVALTSVLVGQLLERGAMRLEDDIHKYVPEYPVKQWPIQVRHLMANTSGLQQDGGDDSPLIAAHCNTRQQAIERFAELPLRVEPGTRFEFTSFGWVLLGAAVEKASGMGLQDALRGLGLAETSLELTSGPDTTWATSYFPRLAAEPKYGHQDLEGLDMACFAGAGGLTSTPADLVRFGMAVQSGKLLKPETVKMLQTPQRLRSGELTSYGLGWAIDKEESPRLVGHEGSIYGGNVASLVMAPDQGVVVAVASNIAYSDAANLARTLAREFARGR